MKFNIKLNNYNDAYFDCSINANPKKLIGIDILHTMLYTYTHISR